MALCASRPLSAQPVQPTGRGPGRGGTLTRGASKYQELESRILSAIQARSVEQLHALVAPDLEVWSAEKSGAIGREEWQQASFASRLASFRVREIAVREFGEQAIVSFLLERYGAGSRLVATDFVVDVWDVRTDVLRVRYVSTPAHPSTPTRGRE